MFYRTTEKQDLRPQSSLGIGSESLKKEHGSQPLTWHIKLEVCIGLLLSLIRAFESSPSSHSTHSTSGRPRIRNSKKSTTGFSDNANKTSVFVSG